MVLSPVAMALMTVWSSYTKTKNITCELISRQEFKLSVMPLSCLLYLDYLFSQWLSEDFQKLWSFLSATEVHGINHSLWQVSQQPTHSFQREKHQDWQPVKTVMDGSSRKCTATQTKWQFLHKHASKYVNTTHRDTQSYLSNSSLSPACIKATTVLVTDVPMLDPIIIGMAACTSSTTQKNIVKICMYKCYL